MRILILTLFCALFAALPGCARPPASEPAIWRIADEDSEIWLFGSVHMLHPETRWRGPRMEAAFASADEFVTETDVSAEAQTAFFALAARYGALPAGETLPELLGPEDAARLERAARQLGLDAAALERQRPWLTALQISATYAIRAGHSPEAGVETILNAEARAQGKRLWHFETPEQQIRVLADLAPADELHFLRLTLRDLDRGERALSAMDEAWAHGDIAALQRQLDHEWADAGPAIHHAVILDRNRNWTEQIAARLEGSGRTFIAVGAAHLIGEGSVVDLLRQRGIEVEGP
jgi:uncharacterized protein YbaP (TraB family)